MCQMRIGKAKSKLLCLKYCIEGNLEGGGDGFPNTSRVLVEYGHSLSINFSTGNTGIQEILPCGQGRIDSVKINPSLLMMRD